MSKRRKPVEAVTSSYTAVPHVVLDSTAFANAGHTARSLLFELIRQHNGRNNGHLHLASPWLKRRGWKSSDVVQRAKRELITRGLVIQTRQGGLNAGASRFALTWLPISNFTDLDIRRESYHPGAWQLMTPLVIRKNQPTQSVKRNSPAPFAGMPQSQAAPPDGAKTAIYEQVTAPSHGNNVCCHLPAKQSARRIVGVAGKSGKAAQAVGTME